MPPKGKVFEVDFKKSAEKYLPHLSIERLRDPIGGQRGIANPCDFIVYKWPCQYFFELKDYNETRINLSVITDTQYSGLLERSKLVGVVAGVLFNFREVNEAYFLNIKDISLMKEKGKKSITVEEARQVGVRLEGVKKVTRFSYAIIPFLNKLEAQAVKPIW